MKRSFFIILLAGFILFTAYNAFAAQMRYSFEFTVSSYATFAGTPLAQGTSCNLDLYGDTEEITTNSSGYQELANLVGEVYIDNIGVYDSNVSWTIVDHWFETGSDGVFAQPNPGGAPLACSIESSVDFKLVDELVWEDFSSLLVLLQVETSGGLLQDLSGGALVSYSQAAVPIPSAMILLSSGLALLIGFRRKFRK